MMRWDARPVRMPLASGRFAVAGEAMAAAEGLLVSVAEGRHRVGFGEAVASTRVLGVSANELVQAFVPLRTQLPVDWPVADLPAVPAELTGPMACAVDGALLDLAGQRAGRSVQDLLELDPGRKPTSATVSLDTPERMANEAQSIEAAGFSILKIKLGGPPDVDIRRLHAVADACPRVEIRVDGNEAWNLDEAISMIPALADSGVSLLEQPMPRNTPRNTLVKLMSVCSNYDVRHFLDEPIRNARDIHRYANAQCLDGVNIKLQKAGGLRPALKAVEAARANGLEVLLGCFVEGWAGIALAAQMVGMVDHVDLDGAWLLAAPPLVPNPAILEGGMIGPSEAPGLGLTARKRTALTE